MKWQIAREKVLLQSPPFNVEELTLRDLSTGEPGPHSYFRLKAPSWVNIFALTSDKKVILVRQPRIGMMQMTLETPGGCIDPGEEPGAAAVRELEEETGYRATTLIPIASISPNPAIMSNRLHMFMASDCKLVSDRKHFPDASEQIEVLTLPLSELDLLVSRGQIHNALASLTILMAQRYILKENF